MQDQRRVSRRPAPRLSSVPPWSGPDSVNDPAGPSVRPSRRRTAMPRASAAAMAGLLVTGGHDHGLCPQVLEIECELLLPVGGIEGCRGRALRRWRRRLRPSPGRSAARWQPGHGLQCRDGGAAGGDPGTGFAIRHRSAMAGPVHQWRVTPHPCRPADLQASHSCPGPVLRSKELSLRRIGSAQYEALPSRMARRSEVVMAGLILIAGPAPWSSDSRRFLPGARTGPERTASP